MKPKFTQRHYEALAAFFSYELEVSGIGTRDSRDRVSVISGIVRLLGHNLQNDNPKFDYARFLKASGVSQ